jgi:hypothetical protein
MSPVRTHTVRPRGHHSRHAAFAWCLARTLRATFLAILQETFIHERYFYWVQRSALRLLHPQLLHLAWGVTHGGDLIPPSKKSNPTL